MELASFSSYLGLVYMHVYMHLHVKIKCVGGMLARAARWLGPHLGIWN